MSPLRAGADDAGRRLDRVVRKARPDVPLSAIHRLFRSGAITVNGAAAGPALRVAAGDEIRVGAVPETRGRRMSRLRGETPCHLARAGYPPGNRPSAPPTLDIILETPHLLFVNKPAGIPTHGPGSLDELARAFLRGALAPSLSFTPGPLHRLDRNTSGVVTFSKTLEGARAFSAALREGRVVKRYLAVLEGRLSAEACWEDRLARVQAARKTVPDSLRGRPARSVARPLAYSDGRTLAEIVLHTGLTHQIRVQAALRGHPLAGDSKYGAKTAPPYFLHAARLDLPPGLRALAPAVIEAPAPVSRRRAAFLADMERADHARGGRSRRLSVLHFLPI